MFKKKWTPSKSNKKKFASEMEKIKVFCSDNNISHSKTYDSYYFILNDIEYRVSNHSIETSNKRAYNCFGEKVRDEYHPNERDKDIIYIHASKTRIIDIYNNLKDGKILDGRGNIKEDNK